MRSDYFQSVISILSAVLFMASSNSDSLHNELASATDLDKLELNGTRELSEGSAISTDYQIFDSAGNVSTLEELITEIRNSDVTFLGEIHTDTVAHDLEALLLEKSWDDKQSLSLEMFESDVQRGCPALVVHGTGPFRRREGAGLRPRDHRDLDQQRSNRPVRPHRHLGRRNSCQRGTNRKTPHPYST